MSVVTTVTIMCAIFEDVPGFTRHAFTMSGEDSYVTPFRDLTQGTIMFCWGGNKMPQARLLCGAFNHLNHTKLTEMFLSWPWRAPENAVMVFQPEDGQSIVIRAVGSRL